MKYRITHKENSPFYYVEYKSWNLWRMGPLTGMWLLDYNTPDEHVCFGFRSMEDAKKHIDKLISGEAVVNNKYPYSQKEKEEEITYYPSEDNY
jgi:hypothetical protein